MIFKKSERDTAVDLLEVEIALRKAFKEVGLFSRNSVNCVRRFSFSRKLVSSC